MRTFSPSMYPSPRSQDTCQRSTLPPLMPSNPVTVSAMPFSTAQPGTVPVSSVRLMPRRAYTVSVSTESSGVAARLALSIYR